MSTSHVFQEPARALPVIADADVIVCGGGPAGVAAALAAARNGANTHLFEMHTCLGGVWTSGLLTYIFDFAKPGLTQEIIHRMEALDALRGENRDRFVYEPEPMKALLEQMCQEAGVHIHLQSRLCAAYRTGRRLDTIVTESRSGRQAWRARVFIDATGDGDLGMLAGCGWEIGRPEDGACQPLTMNAIVTTPDVQALAPYISFFGTDSMPGHVQATKNIVADMRRAGVTPSYGMPTLFQIRDNLLLAMFNHEYGVRPDSEPQMTEATLRSRAEVHHLVEALEKLGGPWRGLHLASTADQIGVREGRRIHGLYELTREDLRQGSSFEDGVTRATFCVDIHAPSKKENEQAAITHSDFHMRSYEIPLRALIARDVDALMMAGRCISGDFIAHASYRVTGNAVAMGEATGVAAALSAARDILPQELAWDDLAPRLPYRSQA
ncbi:MAG: FAD-dependent oxidoreductase [Verrucomicrobiota bacterium JB024]|nr:FAD-dependent oxidoreductase [Verrucomicrobiota bacterium JB024]